MAYGGPERLEDVESYYTDIRRGSPPPPDLLAELLDRYRAIGGGSPLSAIVERQRAGLERELARRGSASRGSAPGASSSRASPVMVRAGMRHTAPRIGAVVGAMAHEGVEEIVAMALTPQRSAALVGYADAVRSALQRLGPVAPVVRFVESWHDEPRLIEALSAATLEALVRVRPGARLQVLFTAHSLPERLGAEALAYRSEVERTAELVAARAGIRGYGVALQSAGRTGEAWLGPELRSEIRRLAADGIEAFVICPVGFVSDHLEVLYDIDIDARAVARDAGATLVRARSMNDDPLFIAALADIVERTVGPAANAGLAGPVDGSDGATTDGAPSTTGHHRPVAPEAIGRPPAVGAVVPTGFVFDRAPMLVYWETTRSCGLACRHCRAVAQPQRSPSELSTEEGLALLRAITGFGRPYPHVVFTGGDPLRRPDLETLVRAATDLGIGASLAPSATADMTPERLVSLREAGIQTMSLSIDGSDAARHDGFRGVPGTFDMTMRAVGWAHAAGLPLQMNTLVTSETLEDLPALHALMGRLGIIRWSLFFLISVGRGSDLREITPGESERLNQWLCDLSKESPFAIKTTEATHYRRVALRRMREEGLDDATIARSAVGRGFGVRDGNGIVFVSDDGSIFPSGFLPLPAGNVRTDDLVRVYREHELFRALRDVSQFRGRCGRCEHVEICGGSRARAWAATGDALEADPLCPYVPRASGDERDHAFAVAR